MNEDILLTNKSPEIVKIVQEYWGAPIILDQDDLEIIIEEACRAQVRKVVEWINDNVDGHAGGYWNYGDRVLHEDKWQALREAAGEGK